jgi:hypothetical protein
VHDTGCIVLQLRKQNEVLIVGLDDAEKKLKRIVIALKYLSRMTFIIWQTHFFAESPLSLKEINHVIERINVLANYQA